MQTQRHPNPTPPGSTPPRTKTRAEVEADSLARLETARRKRAAEEQRRLAAQSISPRDLDLPADATAEERLEAARAAGLRG